MIVRHVIFGIDGHRQRLDGREVQPIEIAEVTLRILDASERRLKRQIEHGQQRHDDDDRDEAEQLAEEHDAERHRAGGEVPDGQPQEVLAPDPEHGTFRLEAYRDGGKPRVQDEVNEREACQRADQRGGRQAALGQRSNTGDPEEHLRRGPDGECRRRHVEGNPVPTMAFPPGEHAGIGCQHDRRCAGTEEKRRCNRKRVGNRDARRDKRDVDGKGARHDAAAAQQHPLPRMRQLDQGARRMDERDRASEDDQRHVHAKRPRGNCGRFGRLGRVRLAVSGLHEISAGRRSRASCPR